MLQLMAVAAAVVQVSWPATVSPTTVAEVQRLVGPAYALEHCYRHEGEALTCSPAAVRVTFSAKPRHVKAAVLGMADRELRMVNVYTDAVGQVFPLQAGADYAVALGRVTAHEIMHALGYGHSGRGLMSSHISPKMLKAATLDPVEAQVAAR